MAGPGFPFGLPKQALNLFDLADHRSQCRCFLLDAAVHCHQSLALINQLGLGCGNGLDAVVEIRGHQCHAFGDSLDERLQLPFRSFLGQTPDLTLRTGLG